jgi:MFS family permease
MIESTKNESPATDDKKQTMLLRWVVALCITAIGTMAITEVQGQWFNSYIKVTAGGLFGASALVAVSAVLSAIFYLFWGTISDNIRTKRGRRVPIYVIGAISTAVLMCIFILTINFVALLIIGGILITITVNMSHVTNRGLLTDLVPQTKRGRINSIIIVMTNIGSMLIWIPAILFLPGGTASYSLQTHQMFILGGALILESSAVALLFLVKEPPVAPPTSTWGKDLKSLFNTKDMLKHKDFFKFFLAIIFLIMSESAFLPFLLILLQDIDLKVMEILTVLPFIGIGIGLGIYFLGKYTDKIGRKKTALICIFFYPIGCFIIAALGNDSLWLIIGFGVMMPFYLGLWIACDSWTQDLLPTESRGRFLGILNIGYALGRIPGVLLAGVIGETYGILAIFFVAGIILWLGLPFFMRVPETLKIKKL